jgi:hypothetical protein
MDREVDVSESENNKAQSGLASSRNDLFDVLLHQLGDLEHLQQLSSTKTQRQMQTMFVSKSIEPTLSTMILYLLATGAPKLRTVSYR